MKTDRSANPQHHYQTMPYHGNMPNMTALAPLIDQLQTLAEQHLPRPFTCRITLYEDGDYYVDIRHSHDHDPDETTGIYYDRETGEVVHAYTKGEYWTMDGEPVDGWVPWVKEFRVDEREVLAAIEPPVG